MKTALSQIINENREERQLIYKRIQHINNATYTNIPVSYLFKFLFSC